MNKYLPFALIFFIACCSQSPSQYLRWVGDSVYDANLDEKNFSLCNGENRVIQYFNLGDGLTYKGERKGLWKEINSQYNSIDVDESGWIRIRFIVNCNGQTGRFRVISADESYNEYKFDNRITDQLLEISKKLDGWEVKVSKGQQVDYYQYLIFKIQQGRLIEILP